MGLGVLGLAVLLAGLVPVARTWLDIRRQQAAMPLLASFEDAWELSRWRDAGARMVRHQGHATHGAWSLQATARLSKAPILGLVWPPQDWRGYDTLAMDIEVAGPKGVTIEVQLDDLEHEHVVGARSLTRWRLEPGPNRLRLPLRDLAAAPESGPLDLGRIARFGIMPIGRDELRTFWLDNVRLERAPPGGPGGAPR